MALGILSQLKQRFLPQERAQIDDRIHKTGVRVTELLDGNTVPRGNMEEALEILGIDTAWNTGKSESVSPIELDWKHIAECLLTGTINYNTCMSNSGKNGGGGEALIYGVIIDDRVISAAEEYQTEFKKRSAQSYDLLNPNAELNTILDHINTVKERLNYNQIQRLLRIYGFTEKNHD